MKKLISLTGPLLLALSSCAGTAATSAASSPSVKEKSEPAEEPAVLSTQYGIASWYSIRTNHGTRTASGRPLQDHAYTAAHRTLKMGTRIRVTNLSNGRSEILRVTDRGPYTKGRVVDVTIGSAKRLGFYSRGLTQVKVEAIR
ncbi:MAG: septal ring lytic transglycosylase RlpA family protein [Verrucomicrobiaceae bacterium]